MSHLLVLLWLVLDVFFEERVDSRGSLDPTPLIGESVFVASWFQILCVYILLSEVDSGNLFEVEGSLGKRGLVHLTSTLEDFATLRKQKKITCLQVEQESFIFGVKAFESVSPASFDRRVLEFTESKRSLEVCDVVFSRSLFGVKNAWLGFASRVVSCFVVRKEEVEVDLEVDLDVGEVFVDLQSGILCFVIIVFFVVISLVILLEDFVLVNYWNYWTEDLIGRLTLELTFNTFLDSHLLPTPCFVSLNQDTPPPDSFGIDTPSCLSFSFLILVLATLERLASLCVHLEVPPALKVLGFSVLLLIFVWLLILVLLLILVWATLGINLIVGFAFLLFDTRLIVSSIHSLLACTHLIDCYPILCFGSLLIAITPTRYLCVPNSTFTSPLLAGFSFGILAW